MEGAIIEGMSEDLILVDGRNRAIGRAEKWAVHQTGLRPLGERTEDRVIAPSHQIDRRVDRASTTSLQHIRAVTRCGRGITCLQPENLARVSAGASRNGSWRRSMP